MPQEDQRTSELNHAEEVSGIAFPAAGESTEVLEPGEEPFDFPAPQVSAQRSTILSSFPLAPVWRDHFDAVSLPKPLVQWIAVVGLIANQALRQGCGMSLCERGFNQRGLIRCSTRN